jgi:hypothetical protein
MCMQIMGFELPLNGGNSCIGVVGFLVMNFFADCY